MSDMQSAQDQEIREGSGEVRSESSGHKEAWLDRWVVQHPVLTFIGASVASVGVFVLLYSMIGLPWEVGFELDDAVTNYVGSMATTVVALAGALVSVVLARLALKLGREARSAAERANQLQEEMKKLSGDHGDATKAAADRANQLQEEMKELSRIGNELSDPDYELSRDAYTNYRKYEMLIGALLASERSQKHLQDLQNYGAALGVVKSESLTNRAWVTLNEQLRSVLLDDAFLLASLEAAKLIDGISATGDKAQHLLRRSMASMLMAVEKELDQKNPHEWKESLSRMMINAAQMNRQLRDGAQAVRDSREEIQQGGNRFLEYISRWMGEFQDAQTGAELAAFAQRGLSAELFTSAGGPLPILDALVEERIENLIAMLGKNREENPNDGTQKGGKSLALHLGMAVTAWAGDHETFMGLPAKVEHAVKRHNPEWKKIWTGRISGAHDLPVPGYDFYIISVSGELQAIRTLFHRNDGIGANELPRGCIIVDGLSRADTYELLEEMFKAGAKVGFEDFLDHIDNGYVERMHKNSGWLWIGIDYREPGRDRPCCAGERDLFEVFSENYKFLTLSDDVRDIAFS